MQTTNSSIKSISIKNKLSLFNDYWNPKIVGRFNGERMQVAKLKGEFVWHEHKNADEVFLVINGHLIIHFRDKDVEVDEGEFIIVPKGIEHKPEAKEEVHIVLIDPEGTVNTGNATSEHKVETPEEI